MIYVPTHFREARTDVLHAAMRAHPFATLITTDGGRPSANHIPMLLDTPGDAALGTLRGHVARANPVTTALAQSESTVLVVFSLGDAYVSPSWYATKGEHGKVVPTWNYGVIHAYGRPRIVTDPVWMAAHLRALTDHQESSHDEPWSVDDAPAEFVEGLARGIVGFEVAIEELVGKCKASQNQPEESRRGVSDALRAEGNVIVAEMVASGSFASTAPPLSR